MKFQRVRRIKGGVLGAHARAITALQETIERIRAGYGIWFSHENNSIAINADRAAGGTLAFSICPSMGSAYAVNVTAGHWVHRYNAHAVDSTVFWYGDPASLPSGGIQLSTGWNYGFLEFNGSACSWSVQSTYPASYTTKLRRCIFSIELEAVPNQNYLAVKTSVVARNAGDIVSW